MITLKALLSILLKTKKKTPKQLGKMMTIRMLK